GSFKDQTWFRSENGENQRWISLLSRPLSKSPKDMPRMQQRVAAASHVMSVHVRPLDISHSR
ncbi:unnamed protein product, partial [Musa textilis]